MKQSNFKKILMPRPAYFSTPSLSRESLAVSIKRTANSSDRQTDRHRASFYNAPSWVRERNKYFQLIRLGLERDSTRVMYSASVGYTSALLRGVQSVSSWSAGEIYSRK